MLHHLVINYYLFHFNRELGLNVGYCINNQISHITQPFMNEQWLISNKHACTQQQAYV